MQHRVHHQKDKQIGVQQLSLRQEDIFIYTYTIINI